MAFNKQKEEQQKTFNEVIAVKPKKQNILKMNHLWKQISYNAFFIKQKHRTEYDANN